MGKSIEVTVVNKYGTALMFPKCELAKIFCEIADRKTVTRPTVEILKKYGYELIITKE